MLRHSSSVFCFLYLVISLLLFSCRNRQLADSFASKQTPRSAADKPGAFLQKPHNVKKKEAKPSFSGKSKAPVAAEVSSGFSAKPAVKGPEGGNSFSSPPKKDKVKTGNFFSAPVKQKTSAEPGNPFAVKTLLKRKSGAPDAFAIKVKRKKYHSEDDPFAIKTGVRRKEQLGDAFAVTVGRKANKEFDNAFAVRMRVGKRTEYGDAFAFKIKRNDHADIGSAFTSKTYSLNVFREIAVALGVFEQNRWEENDPFSGKRQFFGHLFRAKYAGQKFMIGTLLGKRSKKQKTQEGRGDQFTISPKKEKKRKQKEMRKVSQKGLFQPGVLPK